MISHETYLEAGVHIGTRIITREMRPFVYKVRRDKLSMLAIEQIDKRIRETAKALAKFDPAKVIIVASRVYAIPAAKKFAEIIGAKAYIGRFVPGTFTNPSRSDFSEPIAIFVCDPRVERQALRESVELGIAAFGLVDTDNVLKGLDYAIPCNNKGKKSVPLIFFLMAREYQKATGAITSDEQFAWKISDFESGEGEETMEEAVSEEESEEKEEVSKPKTVHKKEKKESQESETGATTEETE